MHFVGFLFSVMCEVVWKVHHQGELWSTLAHHQAKSHSQPVVNSNRATLGHKVWGHGGEALAPCRSPTTQHL